MLFVNKLKVLTLMTCLVLVGQGFAQESSQYSAPGSSSSSKMDLWSNYTSEPATQDIGGLTYYSITSAEELAWFAVRMNETTKSNPNVNTSESAILLADIDLSGKIWVPIAAGKGDGVFMGTFDGNGHKITGLTIDGHRIAYETTNVYCRDKENKPLCNGQNIGFFGSLKGTVKNLSLEVADIQASNSEGLTMQMGKPISVGTLVGWMSAGTIDGVYVSGRINTSGNGQGVGGIVGNAASGTVENSVSDVSIYASGDKVFIGGILGYTKGEVNVHSCMYTGESIINDGKNGSIGGIVGNSTSNKLNATNSFFDTDVAGNKGVGTGSVNNDKKPTGVTDLNTEQVACGMNGKTWDANSQVCSGEGSDEWEVGISELSQNGSDGYKITFVVNAEGAAFPDEAVTTKLVAKNAPITADGISLPTREGYKFAGWAETDNAEDPSPNLGTATGRRTIYAVWYGKFPVTFNAGTGSFPNGTPDPLMVAKGDLVSLDIEIPEKASEGEDHFYFAGWTTGTTSEVIFDKNQDITGLVDFDEFTVAAATTFYPAWTKEIVHTVKFNANGHGQTKLEQVDISDGLVLNAPDNPSPYKGYQYDAWCLTQDCQNSSDVFTFPQTINSSFELFAKWSAVPYTINYNLDGGSVPNPGNPSTYTIEDQFVLVEPSRTCYDFIEWYDSEGNHVEGITKGTTEAKTFSARWKQQTKAINYSTGNVIQATATSQEFLCGKSIALSDTINAFSRPGYTQDGWTTTIGGNNVMAPKALYTGTETVTLYAHWSLNSYDIIYNLYGGEFATPAISSYTTEAAVVLANPTRSGYDFQGWYDNAQFEGDAMTEIPLGSTGIKTFYAKWSDPIEYTITYKIDNETAALTPNGFTVVDNVTLAVPEMADGYIFDGWYLNEEMTGEKVTSFEAGTYAANQTFYGKTIRSYTITYVDADGLENPNLTSYTVLENDLELQPVSKSGFKFLGWFNESDELVESISAGSTGDITLTAKWAEFPILITQSGGVKILQNEDETVVAEIDGNSTETVSFTEDVSVDRVTFDRTFSESVNSTIMLPFTVSVNDVDGGVFYEFANLDQDESGNYHFRVKEPSASTLEANKPYIFIPSAKSITFNLSDRVTINTSVDNPTSSGNWHFIGTYQTRTFTSADPEFGYAYGFAGEEKNGLTLGKFHKVKENARLKPMRGYLLYDESRAMTKSSNVNFSERLSIFDLPEDIDVEILSNSGVVIGGGTYNTRTGVFKMDRWYDLQGRKLNGKPTVQGTYYHNGKRVIVK